MLQGLVLLKAGMEGGGLTLWNGLKAIHNNLKSIMSSKGKCTGGHFEYEPHLFRQNQSLK